MLFLNSYCHRETFQTHPPGTYLESAGAWTDGQYYHAISMGSASGVMLGLKDKLSPKERWAIVLYVRALQSFVSEATLANSDQK